MLGVVFGALAVRALLLIVFFYGLQRYIVFEHDGISVVLPGRHWAPAANRTPAPGFRWRPPSPVEEPGSSVSATAGEGLGDIIALYVPPEDVSPNGIGKYLNVMGQYSGRGRPRVGRKARQRAAGLGLGLERGGELFDQRH